MWPILQRLCWKEFRRGWLMLLLGLLLPPLAVSLNRDRLELLTFDMPTMALFVLMISVAVWASMLAKDARGRQSYAGIHFPQHPGLASLVTYLLQGGVALVIGLSIGYWRAQMGGLYYTDNFPCLGLLYVGSTFAVSYILTLLFSSKVGMAAGILGALVNMQAFTALASYHRNLAMQDTVVHYMGMVIVLAFFAVLCYLLTLRFSRKTRLVLACVLLGIGVLYIPAKGFWESLTHTRQFDCTDNVPTRLCTNDGALTVDYINQQSSVWTSVDLRFVDHRRQHTRTHHFAQAIQPIGFMGDNVVILAQQLKKEPLVTLLRWALDTDSIEPFATLPAHPNSLALTFRTYSPASIAPDGRYGVMFIASPYGDVDHPIPSGFDLWKIDLQHRSVTLLKPLCPSYSYIFGWRDNEAILSSDYFYAVSMETDQMTALPVAIPQEEKE